MRLRGTKDIAARYIDGTEIFDVAGIVLFQERYQSSGFDVVGHVKQIESGDADVGQCHLPHRFSVVD